MILVDTSVLIDLFKGNENEPTCCFREVLQQEVPFGITPVIYQEVLQGAKTKREYSILNEYLSTQRFFTPRIKFYLMPMRPASILTAAERESPYEVQLIVLLPRLLWSMSLFCFITIMTLTR